MIDVGLIGFGVAGKAFHAPVISAVDGLRLAAIVERSRPDAAGAYPDAEIVGSVPELLARENIRLVVVATPNTTHYEIARDALRAGRHVVVDKPLTPSWREGEELARLAREQRVLLSVYQNRRWDGDFLTVRKLIEEQRLGQLVLYASHFDRYRPEPRPSAWREQPEPGSGLLFDLGTHLIDQAVLLFGAPQALRADVLAERQGALVDDAFDVVLRYPTLRVSLHASMLRSSPRARFALHGTRGSYVKYGLDPQEEALRRGETPLRNSLGVERPEAWGTLSTAENGQIESRPLETLAGEYGRYYENVRDAILGKTQLAVTPEQALTVLQIIELARQSSARGCEVPFARH
jgi:predicted dehydrogenase